MALPANKNDNLSYAVTARVDQTTASSADGQAAQPSGRRLPCRILSGRRHGGDPFLPRASFRADSHDDETSQIIHYLSICVY